MKWPEVPLPQVALINPSRPPNLEIVDDQLVTFAPMSAVSEQTATVEHPEKRPYSDVKKGFTYFEENDVLFAKITPCMENGKSAIASDLIGGIGFGSTEFHVIRSNQYLLLPKYVHFFIRQQSFRDNAKARMRGAVGQQRVPKDFLDDTILPLPPISEQNQIVEILDQADRLRKLRAEADAKAQRILSALFFKMFGDTVTNPKGLEKKKLGDLIKVKSGNFLPAKNMDPKGQFPVYGGNGINGYHSEYMFKESIIVLGRVGIYCGAVHYTEPNCWVTDNALYVAEHSDKLQNRYLAEALRVANLNQYAGRAGQPLISGGRIYPVEILVPTIEDQERFSIRIAEIHNAEEHQDGSRAYLEKLFSVLLHRAFTGDLTASWRKEHMKEMLKEMELQAKALAS